MVVNAGTRVRVCHASHRPLSTTPRKYLAFDTVAQTVAPRPAFSPTRLRQARLAAGFSRTALAAAIERNYFVVANLEQGKHQPTSDTLGALAAVLGIDVGALFDTPQVA